MHANKSVSSSTFDIIKMTLIKKNENKQFKLLQVIPISNQTFKKKSRVHCTNEISNIQLHTSNEFL